MHRPVDSRPATASEITAILADWSDRDEQALDKLLPVVFEELRQLASFYFLREAPGHTLQPTAVVNEVYLRLIGSKVGEFTSRKQFFAFASRLIREVLTDYARARRSLKRGGKVAKVSFDEAISVPGARPLSPEMLLTVHDTLTQLEEVDPRLCRIVELRYFAGLTLREVAQVLGVSLATAERGWSAARRWLARGIQGPL